MREELSGYLGESLGLRGVSVDGSWIVGVEKSPVVQAAFLGCAVLLGISIAVIISQHPGWTGE